MLTLPFGLQVPNKSRKQFKVTLRGNRSLSSTILSLQRKRPVPFPTNLSRTIVAQVTTLSLYDRDMFSALSQSRFGPATQLKYGDTAEMCIERMRLYIVECDGPAD